MSDLIWHITMSLDGFIAGPGHAMQRLLQSGGPNAMADEVLRGTGAILGGRRWYDIAVEQYDGVDGMYGGSWNGPVFVLTSHPCDAPADPRVAFLGGGIEDAVATAREAARGADVVVFGAGVARECLDAGLLEELVVHLAPVLLGDGIRLYGGPGVAPVGLERTAFDSSGQVTDLRFRVARSA
jgi:dihydrofolate reductase